MNRDFEYSSFHVCFYKTLVDKLLLPIPKHHVGISPVSNPPFSSARATGYTLCFTIPTLPSWAWIPYIGTLKSSFSVTLHLFQCHRRAPTSKSIRAPATAVINMPERGNELKFEVEDDVEELEIVEL